MDIKLVYIENQEEFNELTSKYIAKCQYGNFGLHYFKFEGPKKYMFEQYKSIFSDKYITYFYTETKAKERLNELNTKLEELSNEIKKVKEYLEQDNNV